MPRIKINLIGAGGTGKTQLIHHYIGKPVSKDRHYLTQSNAPYSSLAQKRVELKDFVSLISAEFFEWDLVKGPQKLRKHTDEQRYGFHAIVLTVDLTNLDSLNAAYLKAARGYDLPIFVIATHKDSENRKISSEALNEFVKANDLQGCYEVSASTGENIETAFSEILTHVSLRLENNKEVSVLREECDSARNAFKKAWEKTGLKKSILDKLVNLIKGGNGEEAMAEIKQTLTPLIIRYRDGLHSALSSEAQYVSRGEKGWTIFENEKAIVSEIDALDKVIKSINESNSLNELEDNLDLDWANKQQIIPKDIWDLINDFITSIKEAISQLGESAAPKI